MQENESQNALTYQIASKQPFLVVSFSGALSRTGGPTLEKCEGEILNSQAKYVVLNMQNAADLERPLIAALVRLQKHIRDSSMSLRVCNMSVELKKELVDAGAVRESEVVPGLKEALTSLAKIGTGSAAGAPPQAAA